MTIIEPFVTLGKLGAGFRHEQELTPAHVREADVVVIATDHSEFDYEMIAANASAIFDTRNRISGEAAGDFERL